MESKICKVSEVKFQSLKKNYAIRFVKTFVRDYAAMSLRFFTLI